MMHQFSKMALPDWTCPTASGRSWLAGRASSISDVGTSGGIRLAAGLLSWELMFRLSSMKGHDLPAFRQADRSQAVMRKKAVLWREMAAHEGMKRNSCNMPGKEFRWPSQRMAAPAMDAVRPSPEGECLLRPCGKQNPDLEWPTASRPACRGKQSGWPEQ
ncbi:hypothetical protein [Paracoccus aerius]|uniref:hypothetical protein n=1 Tax=Paracoccus aerius TaxID=1915382 RepID=UPI001F431CB0|nr:hypothetical protein [Paracoccus aerius]